MSIFLEKFGRNPAAAVGEVIQDAGGVIVIETVASKIELIGDSANDTAAGSGAKAMKVWGVDINWNVISEEIVTAGLSVSAESVESYLYVFRSKIVASGAQRNDGNMTIRKSGAGATVMRIPAGYGQSEKAVFPVPAGHTLYMTKFQMEGIKNSALTGEVGLFEYCEGVGIRCTHPLLFSQGSGGKREWPEGAKFFREKTLVWVEVISLSAAAVVAASFSGKLIKNNT